MFDLCHDFSFWQAETGRCIPKQLNDDVRYTFPPLCNRTDFDCLEGWFSYNCPNLDESCEGFTHSKTWFFCNDSKTCIPNGNKLTYSHLIELLEDFFNFRKDL